MKNIVLNILKKIRKVVKLKINKIGSRKRNSKLKSKNITIISNNCFAGLTYEYLNLPYMSPTIGLFFFAEEYLKFIKNLRYYTTLPVENLPIEKSKYYHELKKIGQENCIIGLLDDVEIVFLHYSSFDEAKEKWEKRCKRIDFNNIIYKFCDQNLCTEENLREFASLDLPNKICFTAKKYDYPNFYQIKKYKNRDFVKDDAFCYHKYFDIVDYINKTFLNMSVNV